MRAGRGTYAPCVHGMSDASIEALGKLVLDYAEERLKLDPVPLDYTLCLLYTSPSPRDRG